jgi:predicted RNA-binding Zn-ribbon protein involved in translation (DUF1610 family)
MIDLKPCPFCGDKAFMISYALGKSGKEIHRVCCNGSKGCSTCTAIWRSTKQEAAEDWNRRAERICLYSEATENKLATCNICGMGLGTEYTSAFHYCPGCGAKIEKEID